MSTNTQNKLLYGELGYRLNGLLFAVHNELGRYAKEKQYANLLEEKFKTAGILYKRELDGYKTTHLCHSGIPRLWEGYPESSASIGPKLDSGYFPQAENSGMTQFCNHLNISI